MLRASEQYEYAGPDVKLIKVECSKEVYDERLWVTNSDSIPGCKVIEGALNRGVQYNPTMGRYEAVGPAIGDR